MDESLFLMLLLCGFLMYVSVPFHDLSPPPPYAQSRVRYALDRHTLTRVLTKRAERSFAAIIWCFLSTCLGLEIRRADVWEAFTPSAFSAKERQRRARMARGEYLELDDMRGNTLGSVGYDRLSGGRVGDEIEFMRRGGPSGRFY